MDNNMDYNEGNNFGLFGFSPVLLSYRGMQGLYTYIVYAEV